LLQEAEGYLDLILAVSEPLPLGALHRTRLAQRAIEVLDQLDHSEFCRGRGYYLRGQAYRLMERYPEAIDALLKSVELDPLNVHVYLALAWCYKRSERIDLAIQSLEDALEIDPERGILHYNLACYWSLAKNVGLALAHLAKAIESSENYRLLVADEPDFDAVRNHPEFLALANEIV
jgi:tetratricopeptide (TPR) repeat protein